MFTNIIGKLSERFSRNGTGHKDSARRSGRANRRYAIGQGIEGLEGRLALSGAIAPILVTVTNQPPPPPVQTTPIDLADPNQAVVA